MDYLEILVQLILQTIHYGNPRVQKPDQTSYFIVLKKKLLAANKLKTQKKFEID
jgi:hypothetical protein